MRRRINSVGILLAAGVARFRFDLPLIREISQIFRCFSFSVFVLILVLNHVCSSVTFNHIAATKLSFTLMNFPNRRVRKMRPASPPPHGRFV